MISFYSKPDNILQSDSDEEVTRDEFILYANHVLAQIPRLPLFDLYEIGDEVSD